MDHIMGHSDDLLLQSIVQLLFIPMPSFDKDENRIHVTHMCVRAFRHHFIIILYIYGLFSDVVSYEMIIRVALLLYPGWRLALAECKKWSLDT